MDTDATSSWCSFVPHNFLSMIANDENFGAESRESARKTIDEGDALLDKVESSEPLTMVETILGKDCEGPNQLKRLIYDANFKCNLPGQICPLSEIHETSQEELVYNNLGRIFDFFDLGFGHKLFADKQCTIVVTVNYGYNHMNAHWTGRRVILGRGAPHLLSNFHKADDVLAHELTHGIIMRTSDLKNTGETGALSEHLADVFGLLYKQRKNSCTLDAKDCPWVIGEQLWDDDGHFFFKQYSQLHPHQTGDWRVLPAINKEILTFAKLPQYLRSFADPESTNPAQPIHYDDFQNLSYDNDDGVHSNSGIANYAFYTAAIAAGGPPWQGVGQVWFRAMTDPSLGADCKFARFAAFTMAYARRDYPQLAKPITKGWDTVGVVPDC